MFKALVIEQEANSLNSSKLLVLMLFFSGEKCGNIVWVINSGKTEKTVNFH